MRRRAELRPGLVQPVHRTDLGAFVVGVVGSIFAFWGWDTCLTLGEESKDPTKAGPGRAALRHHDPADLPVGVGGGDDVRRGRRQGLGLGNEENSDNVFGALADPVLGSLGGLMLYLAVLVVLGGEPADHVPARRPRDAGDGRLRCVPEEVRRGPSEVPGAVVQHLRGWRHHRRVLHGGQLLSESALLDTIAALGIMICWYYGITAFACVWYFQRDYSPTCTTSCSG